MISMAAQAQPTENAFAERSIRISKEEEGYFHDRQDYADAHTHNARFPDEVYMHKRPHSALGYLPPAEYQATYITAHGIALTG